MTITMRLNYIDELSGGRKRFRRRFPKEVREVIGREFFQVPMRSTNGAKLVAEKDALLVEFDKIVKEAKRRLRGVDKVTPRQLWADAKAKADEMVSSVVVFQDDDDDQQLDEDDLKREIVADLIESEGKDPLLYKAVVSPSAPDPEPTLQDAKTLYREERLAGDAGRNQENRLDRICSRLIDALGPLESIPLSSLRRAHGRAVRDHMLSQKKADGSPLSPSSIKREMNMVKAMVNLALVEFDLKGSVVNPFEKLEFPKGLATGGPQASEGDRREPLPPEVISKMRDRLSMQKSQVLYLIWRLLEGTGCRGSEITGLRREDVHDLDGPYPHIRVEWHEDRRVKTAVSIRSVPLIGDALEATKEALSASSGNPMLFPRYARPGGADAASQALMKHLRKFTDNHRHAVYSLRHNMKDRLVAAGVPERDEKRILGHSVGDLSDRVYGGAEGRLRALHKAMERALGG
ncbi:MAG: hypothetical protein EA407_13000 [Rhodobacteraceae bacterium]|nr:MAG: hypothetical protein EA407_13000 [Paracoccaceae bacterium]